MSRCRYWTTRRTINDVDPRNFTRKFTLFSFDKLWTLTHWSRFYSVRSLEQSQARLDNGSRPSTQILMSLSLLVNTQSQIFTTCRLLVAMAKWSGSWLISWNNENVWRDTSCVSPDGRCGTLGVVFITNKSVIIFHKCVLWTRLEVWDSKNDFLVLGPITDSYWNVNPINLWDRSFVDYHPPPWKVYHNITSPPSREQRELNC